MRFIGSIIENLKNFFNVFNTLKFWGLAGAFVEIFIIAFIIYKILMWIKNTRAWIILRGMLVIVIFIWISGYLIGKFS